MTKICHFGPMAASFHIIYVTFQLYDVSNVVAYTHVQITIIVSYVM